MHPLQTLFNNNRAWARSMEIEDPGFFTNLSSLQAPDYLWIGCADSRVPANEITGLLPGELFVHRNVANVVVHSDLNCLSVLQYAVDVLEVQDIIVCGHYGCGGVTAALRGAKYGLIDNWLRHVQDVAHAHRDQLARLEGEPAKANRLVELHAIEQVVNVCRTTVLQSAWERGAKVRVHGLVYGLADGILRDLHISASTLEELGDRYHDAVRRPAD